jgi:hypothetical protein
MSPASKGMLARTILFLIGLHSVSSYSASIQIMVSKQTLSSKPTAASFSPFKMLLSDPKRKSYRESSDLISCFGTRNVKIGVCQGSSCMAKCKGDFNPLTSLQSIGTDPTEKEIEIEEVFCLDACKRGPNARIYVDGYIASVDSMSALDNSRKLFTALCRDTDVSRVWAVAKDLAAGRIEAELFEQSPDGRYLKATPQTSSEA